MCSKGGGSPPVPNSASTSFQSTTTPAPFATPLYQDFLSRADALSNTPFNPAMLGQVAPMNAQQTQAGNQMFAQGMDMGNFDPAKVQSMESPFIQDVVGKTQDWFNNQNAIQGNDLLSQAIKSGNAFGGDRAGVAEGVMAGQQQLAQAPVIAGLYQSGYTQALNEYNMLKQMGLQGSQAALGWGGMEQAQTQREMDVSQQNAMMQSAYPFQTLNWYGAALGGVAPLLGAQTVGFNTPPDQSGLATGVGAASAAIGLGNAAFGGGGRKHGGGVSRRARGGLVPVYIRHNGGIIPGLAYGGSSDDDDDQHEPAGLPKQADERAQSEDYKPPQVGLPEREKAPSWGGQIGQLKSGSKQTTPSTFPGVGSSSTTAQPSTASQITQGLQLGSAAVSLGSKLLPALALLRHGGGVGHFANGGGDDDQLTMTDIGVLDPQGRELSPGIAGPSRGSPAGNPEQADDMPNLARVRERFRPMLENNAALRKKFDVNTTAEAGTDQAARDFYQGLTLDRAAARGESLPYTLSRGPGTPDRFYPGVTTNARTASGIGVSPALWGGANPANYGTGNASRDPLTGRDVGFAGGPQTGSVGGERGGIEGPDLAAARRFGYRGPSTTAIGFGPGAPQGTYGGDRSAAAEAKQSYPEGEREKVGVTPDQERKQGQAGPGADTGTGAVGRKIPGLEKPAPTFAQRLANDPFWQFGTALMAKPGLKRYPFQGVGAAAQSMSGQQQVQRRQDLLDAKPEMFDDGKQLHALHPDGTLTPTGLPSPTGVKQKNALELQAAKQHGDEKFKTFNTPYGTATGARQPDGRYVDTETGDVLYDPLNPTKGGAGAGAGAAAKPSAQPPAEQQPRVIQPPRQSELTPRTEEQWPDKTKVAAQPPAVEEPPATPATQKPPAQPAQTAQAGPGQDLTAGGQLPTETEEQKQVAAQIGASGAKFKSPLNADPRLLRSMGVTPEQFDGLALRLAHGDESITKGMGNSKAAGIARNALRARANQFYTDQGMSESEANKAISAFGAQKAGARALGTQDARITGAIEQAKMVAPRVLEASAKVDRTNYPNLNSIILAVQKGTGDENVLRLNTAVHALVQNYAAAMGKGNNVLTDTAARRASELINQNFSDPQMRAVVDQMMIEMNSESAGVKNAMKVYLGQSTPGGGGGQPQTQQPQTQQARPVPSEQDRALGRDPRYRDRFIKQFGIEP